MSRYIVSTDMGGTFVDAVVWDVGEGRYSIGKAPTTPADPPAGIVAAVAAAAQRGELTLERVLGDAALFVNGTTVTTNAMIERKGAPTGLMITVGFEDTLAIGNVIARTAGLDETQLLDYRNAERPPAVVPRRLVRGVHERIDARGEVLVPLDEAQAIRALDELVEQGVEALAICLLWSFRAPAHEQRLKAIAEQRHPKLFAVASSDLVPILREFERANTTAINAYLGPVFERYARGLRDRLGNEGFRGEPLVMQSVGGLARVREIERAPIATLFSGPVGGVIAGRALATEIDAPNIITTDMGGTSFDVGLIIDGEPVVVAETVIERQYVAIPTVAIDTIGAGGGSIAKVDELGILQVGPQSAGAVPGPACYGRGGTAATVTDADVMLGFIDADHVLGGSMTISRERAERALEDIARPLGTDAIEAAAAVYRIVNARMADLIRRATVERGYDPREFVLTAFGGCGPTHCTGYGPEIGARRIVVPPSATVFSAIGIGQADLKHSWVRAFARQLRGADGRVVGEPLAEINAILSGLAEEARAQLDRDGVAPEQARLAFGADIRYRSQIHELAVPLPCAPPLAEAHLSEIVAAFHARYDQRYGGGASSPRAPIEWVNLRLDALAPVHVGASMRLSERPAARLEDAVIGRKPIYDIAALRLREAQLYQAERLAPGHRIDGLALIVSYGFTLPLHFGQSLVVDPHGHFVVSY
ncbi:MAG: hydantoinase/oxoprolinase family protein [Hyphomicrobiales bacterium]|nr:hydantoinase/oxoprolinase family protein [Hyphomicrobiales bacterium]